MTLKLLRKTSPAGRSLVCALIVLLGGCRPDCTPTSEPPRRNVILVTVDTLRADHLGPHDGSPTRTPELDRLARDGVVFAQSYAAANTTVPSHLSLLTSLPMATHGLTTNGGELLEPVVTLPHLFTAAGYRTAAVVSVKHLGPEFALGAALPDLDLYDAPRRLSVPSSAEVTNEHVFEWLGETCREPFFLWVHYWDPHMPYTPPSPFDAADGDGNLRTQATSMDAATFTWAFYERPRLRQVLADRSDQLARLERELGVGWRQLRSLIYQPYGLEVYVEDPEKAEEARRELVQLADVVRSRVPLRRNLARWLSGVHDVQYPRARYAGEVSYVDHEIGRLRAELERLDIAGRTVLAVTGDHGESLGEHGIYFDHAGLYEDTLRVPLIIWAPGILQPARPDAVARGLDVAPTLLALAGLAPGDAMTGRDLLSTETGEGSGAPGEPVVAESAGRRQIAIVDGRWKLIRTLSSFYYVPAFVRRGGTVELYDVETDPAERHDLSADRPDVARRLDARLDEWLALHGPPVAAPPVDGQDRLRALGYVE